MKGCSGVCSCESNRESKLAALVEERERWKRAREREKGRERQSSVEGSRVRRVADAESLQLTVQRTHPL